MSKLLTSEWLTNKVIAIIIIIGFMLLLQKLIINLIQERIHYKNQAITDISESLSGAQKIIGPFLVIPYMVKEDSYDMVKKQYNRSSLLKYHYVLPKRLSININDLEVTNRSLAIYKTQIYNGDFIFEGEFGEINLDALNLNNDEAIIQEPYITVALGDTRGINDITPLQFNEQSLYFKPEGKHINVPHGLHVPIKKESLLHDKNSFSFTLNLSGSRQLQVVPIGETSILKIQSNWKDPSFVGSIAPKERIVNEKGFSATWMSSWFANPMKEYFNNKNMLMNIPTSFDLKLVDVVDHYQQNMRSVKYGILLVGLTFLSFFLFDIIRQLEVHPIQYGLIGGALVIFYLVLLAFSEYMSFFLAYLLASLACSFLIGGYLSAILKNIKLGITMMTILFILYGLLYIILVAVGNALLIGTIAIFIFLATTMFFTRNINWNQIGKEQNKPPMITPEISN